MQKLGYKNNFFINDLLQVGKLNVFWDKWLTKLKNDDQIKLPYFENSINTLGKDISLEAIRNFL